jgi:hypothetical protein
MSHALEVLPYSIATLKRLLARKSSGSVVKTKLHTLYFENYFKRVHASSIVVEREYIDRDFLEDFAGYYVRCFSEYEHKCARLHFFGAPFSQSDLEKALDGSVSVINRFQKSYLGFVVIKPLPQTIIGRTCLATYPEKQGRSFPITRYYDANLCGLALTVKSLAYQEQDRVAAACATSALWSVFHGTGKLFHHHIPSPVEITQAANLAVSSGSRSLPSQGLSASQIAAAMRAVGLEPFHVNAADDYVLKSTLYGYLRGHVPILLGVDLYAKDGTDYKFDGKHAVAVTGCRLKSGKAVPHGATGFLLRASRVNKIYVHDDQVGPFARMVFDGLKVGAKKLMSLSTSWGDQNGNPGGVRAVPGVMLVPLYHKIRIPYEAVHDLVVSFDTFMEMLCALAPKILPSRPEWDIYLTTVNEYKSQLLAGKILPAAYKREALQESMPRFIWQASAVIDQRPVLDLLFDATDIEQGKLFVRAVEYDSALGGFLRHVCKEPKLRKLFSDGPEVKVIDWFVTGKP